MTTAPDAPPARLRSPALPFGGSSSCRSTPSSAWSWCCSSRARSSSRTAFLTSDNMLNVLRQGSIVGVLAIGMTFVIATAGIDLSVGSMVAAAGDRRRPARRLGELRVHPRRARAWASCSAAINGARDRLRRVVPFIATLAMFTIARGLALWISDKTPISVFDLEASRWFGTGEIIGIPSAVLVFVGVTALGLGAAQSDRYGRYVVAVGGNREAARIAGVKVQRIVFSVYVLSGICVGDRRDPAVRPAGERVARRGQPVRARRDRRRGDRRHRACRAVAPRSSGRSWAS